MYPAVTDLNADVSYLQLYSGIPCLWANLILMLFKRCVKTRWLCIAGHFHHVCQEFTEDDDLQSCYIRQNYW